MSVIHLSSSKEYLQMISPIIQNPTVTSLITHIFFIHIHIFTFLFRLTFSVILYTSVFILLLYLVTLLIQQFITEYILKSHFFTIHFHQLLEECFLFDFYFSSTVFIMMSIWDNYFCFSLWFVLIMMLLMNLFV